MLPEKMRKSGYFAKQINSAMVAENSRCPYILATKAGSPTADLLF
jgi:hypothetical protein